MLSAIVLLAAVTAGAQASPADVTNIALSRTIAQRVGDPSGPVLVHP